MTKEQIRNIIELFIAWNGENMPIDIANLDSAVDFIYSCQDEEKLDELALEYFNKQWSTNYKSLSEITDDLDLQAVADFKAGYRKAKEK